MRVLVPLENTGGGGIARVGRDLVGALSANVGDGDELLIVGSAGHTEPRPNVRHVRRWGTSRGRVRRLLSDQITLGLSARQADLIHMPDAKAPLLSSRPFLLTLHDLFFIDHPDWFPPSVRAYKHRLLTVSLWRGPRAIVCVSNHTRGRLEAHYPAAFERCPVEVIYPGVEWGFRAQPAGAPAESSDYFLTVSAIEPRKNHLGLLAAFQAARRNGLALRWKVVGRPQYAGAPIHAALTAAEGVDVLGRVGDAELERLYRGARFVATPSFAEGFGIPPLEAMARGVPVVCASGSALDETVGDAALRLAPEDEAGWASALIQLTSDAGLRERLIAAGLTNVRRFTWERAAIAHLELFHRVLSPET